MHCEDEDHPKLTKLSSSRSMPELDRLPWLTDSLNKGSCDEVDSTTQQGASSPQARAPSPIALGPPPALPYGPILPDLISTPSLIYKDISDPDADQGKSGFHNLGNTCFMNAGLQCLLSNPQMSNYFLEQSDLDLSDTSLLAQYRQILHKVWQGKYSILNLSDFKRTLGLHHPQFQDYRQHDCQEFLALVLDSLHEELNSCPSTTKLHLAPATSGPSGEASANDTTSHRQKIKNQLSPLDEDYDDPVISIGGSTQEAKGEGGDVISKKDAEENQETLPKMAQLIDEKPQATGEMAKVVQEIPTQDIESSPPQPDSSWQKTVEDKQSQGHNDVVLNNVQRKFPTLEDLYMKDTKVLNVNMLATEVEVEEVALGSEKYHKPDNRNPRAEEELEDTAMFMEDIAGGMDSDILEFEASDEKIGSPLKPLKETNLLANHKEKFSDDPYGKKLLFSEYCQGEDETDCSINKIKRIKIEEEIEKKEKNVHTEKLMNVNWDGYKQEVMVDVCAGASQDGATSWKNAGEFRNGNLLDDQRLKQLSPQSNQKSLSRSQVDLQGLSSPPQLSFNNEAYMWSRYNLEADKEWKRYLEKNQSVIVDTFQGQFKSTVVCSECHHVSVTFEPFMYLSVPLPHAMERQLSVIFVPCDNKQPVRYLLTLHKNDKLGKLIEALRGLIKEESCDLVVAEVFDNHIARTLEDQMLLKYVNDEARTLYAFEMLPVPSDLEPKVSKTISNPVSGPASTIPNNSVPASVNTPTATSVTEGDIQSGHTSVLCTSVTEDPGNEITASLAGSQAFMGDSNGCVPSTNEQEILNNSVQSSGTAQSHSTLGLRNDIHFQANLLNPETLQNSIEMDFGESSASSSSGGSVGEDGKQKPTLNASDNRRLEGNVRLESEARAVPAMHGDIDLDGELTNDSTGEQMEFTKWRSCAICLEEMCDVELMIHASCGGTLCHTCLDMSFKHYGETEFLCPVCSQAVVPAEDFVQVNCMADYKPKTRILSVAVMQRHEVDADGKSELSIFGHPNLLYLPSELSGEMLYNHVDRVVPVLANYTIVLTDGQGLHCSRCLYTEHCSGCLVSRDLLVTLQPGDHLTVCFTGLDIVQRVNAGTYEDHKSMEELRSKHPLKLSYCFTAFTQSERLDEHNPWYCPRCCKNQCASKTMTVWRFPQTLVVYLKRFVFHELMSTKIESKVEFPLDNLDLYHFISGPKNTNLTYSLQSCVCHYGNVNSGHYTAYAKHPMTEKWYYFNDEQISERLPGEEEYSSAYVLFYQRKDENSSFNLSQVKKYFSKEWCTADVEMTDTCQSNSNPWLLPGSSSHLQSSQQIVLNNAKKDNTEQLPDSTSTGYDFYS